MIRKRGAPVLVELMRKQTPGSAHGISTPAEHQPVHTLPPLAEPKAAPRPPRLDPVIEPGLNGSAVWGDAAPIGSSSARGGRDYRLLAIIGASAIALIALVAVIAFSAGKKKSSDNWATLNAGDAPAGENGGGAPPVVTDPLNPPSATPKNPSGLGAPFNPQDPNAQPTPVNPGPAAAGADNDLQSGWNYLIVATLNLNDASAAGQYLANNGIPVKIVPADKVDPRSAKANNGLWQVLVLRGVPKGEFTQRQAERNALVSQVQRLGKKWKAENKKAPTEFEAPYWVKYAK